MYYSIYDVADFLLNGETTPSKDAAEPPVATQLPLQKKKLTKAKVSVQDLSHTFLLRAFAQSLEERTTVMFSLAENLKNYANKKELMQNFEKKFPQKSQGEN